MSACSVPALSFTLADVHADPMAVLCVVQGAAPILSSEGWGHAGLAGNRDHGTARTEMLQPYYVEQFVRAAEWLDLFPAQKTINRRRSSYAWKHVAEHWHERRAADGHGYISNGMFLAACVAMGRRIEPVWRSPNPYVAIPERARRVQ